MKTITINGVDSAGRLILSDNGHTKAKRGERIRWKLLNSATPVISIENVYLKPNSPKDIFSGHNGNRPSKDDTKNWKADIADDVQKNDETLYSIDWKHTDGRVITHDPKISINPSFAPALLVSIVVGALALTYLLFRRFRRVK